MTILRTDTKHKKYGESVLLHLCDATDSDIDLRLLLVNAGEECAIGVLKLKILLGLGSEELLTRLTDIIASGACYRISDMQINGNDLAELGIKGREIGETLNSLLLMIAKGEVENNREELLKEVSK